MQLKHCSYPLSLRHTFRVATYTRTKTPDVLVAIEHDGITGYGEASMPPYLGETTESVLHFLHQVDLTQFASPEPIDEILEYVDQLMPDNRAAKAAIDIALHDWLGKAQGKPIYDLWNIVPTPLVPTTYTIGIDTPQKIRQKVLEVQGQFKRLKIKVGTQHDKTLIDAIRAVSDLPLTVDANQGWTDREQALDQIYWLKEQGVIMVEQPLPRHQLDDMAWLRQHSPLPLIADESVQRLCDIETVADCFHGINIKLMKCTGLAEARRMIQEIQQRGLLVMLGCMTETSCAISAVSQLVHLADYVDIDGHLLIENDPFDGAQLRNGMIYPTDRPGIGATLRDLSLFTVK